MNAFDAAKRKKRKRGGMVEGHAPRVRMDRKVKGGSVTKSDFNAAINDQPARPTFDEPNALPAVHTRARGGATPDMGWVDGQPGRKSGGKWIAGAIKHPGALHRELGVPQGKKIPEKKLEKAEHSDNPTLRKRAQLAETLKGFHK